MIPPLLDYMKQNKYAVFEGGEFNLNLVAIRSKSREANYYDDWFCAVYKDGSGQWVERTWACTTDPGTFYLKNPMNSKGTAILVPGQYRGGWKLGLHKGKSAALVQNKAVKVFRDATRDTELNLSKIDVGFFGINIHRSFSASELVGKNSAGCIVFANLNDFEMFIDLCKYSSRQFGDVFTVTLLDQWW